MKTTVIAECPVCREELRVRSLSCRKCSTELRGDFELDPLTKLSDTQRKFVIMFLQTGGNLKEMERLMGVSYPTVRARLGEVLAALGETPHIAAQTKSRQEILGELSAGKISTQEAAQQINDILIYEEKNK